MEISLLSRTAGEAVSSLRGEEQEPCPNFHVRWRVRVLLCWRASSNDIAASNEEKISTNRKKFHGTSPILQRFRGDRVGTSFAVAPGALPAAKTRQVRELGELGWQRILNAVDLPGHELDSLHSRYP